MLEACACVPAPLGIAGRTTKRELELSYHWFFRQGLFWPRMHQQGEMPSTAHALPTTPLLIWDIRYVCLSRLYSVCDLPQIIVDCTQTRCNVAAGWGRSTAGKLLGQQWPLKPRRQTRACSHGPQGGGFQSTTTQGGRQLEPALLQWSSSSGGTPQPYQT